MEFIVKSGQAEKQKTPLIVIPFYSPHRLSSTAERMNHQCKGLLSKLIEKGDLEGQYGQVLLLHDVEGLPAPRVLLLGCGAQNEMTEGQFKTLLSNMLHAILDTHAQEVCFSLMDLQVKDHDISWKIQQIIQQCHHYFYRFDEYKTQKNPVKNSIRRFIFLVNGKKEFKLAENAVAQSVAVCHGIELAKNLANTPANLCTPAFLATQAKKLAKAHAKISTAILEEKEMASLGMGSLLSVTKGSTTAAKLITMEYRGTAKDIKPIVLVGKGITFDTGGHSVKVPPHMIGMKYDMCGAATVFGVMAAASLLGLELNIIGVIPSCDNMIGPDATKPEDIVTSMSGLSIEILNTDAEGRLILADALTYSERFHPELVIDIATLTGACQLALGPYASGLMSNHEPLAQELLSAGFESNDKVWQLPLWDEYHEALKSEFADISNIPYSDIGAKTIVAGCFLAKFAEKFHWAHLDVANTATYHGAKRGASGRPIPLLVQFLMNRCKK